MKKILETIGVSLSRAVEHVVDKNRKAAQINRLKLVIRNEERISEKAYAALGKYYYHHLRDASDPITEPHCAAIDHASRRMDRAITRLEELCVPSGCSEEDCSTCGYDCSACEAFGEDEDFSDEMADSPEEADQTEEAAPAEEACAPAEGEAAPEEEEGAYQEEEPELPAQPPVDCTPREVAESRDNRDIPFI